MPIFNITVDGETFTCEITLTDKGWDLIDKAIANREINWFAEELDMGEKKRQPFEVRNDGGELLAMGVYYVDGNCQVYWRKSLGWTGEQFHSIEKMFFIEEGATTVRFTDELPEVHE